MGTPNKLTPEQITKIQQLRQQGVTAAALAERFSVNADTIRRAVRTDTDIWEATESLWRQPQHRQCGSPTPSQGCQGACAPK